MCLCVCESVSYVCLSFDDLLYGTGFASLQCCVFLLFVVFSLFALVLRLRLIAISHPFMCVCVCVCVFIDWHDAVQWANVAKVAGVPLLDMFGSFTIFAQYRQLETVSVFFPRQVASTPPMSHPCVFLRVSVSACVPASCRVLCSVLCPRSTPLFFAS